MRRKKLEVTELSEIEEIIRRCEVCRLGFTDGEIPYIVPMNFGYTLEEGELCLYFHCAKEGRKLDLLTKNPNVCFEMDNPQGFLPGDIPSHASYAYECIMGEGMVQILTDIEEKQKALDRLMSQYMGEGSYDYTDSCLREVTVLKVTSQSFTAKHCNQ